MTSKSNRAARANDKLKTKGICKVNKDKEMLVKIFKFHGSGSSTSKRTEMEESKREFSILMFILAAIFGLLNSYHEATMFENYRHFSHLSNLEREMSFRTEMGLYYSYFKTIIEAPTLTTGLQMITNDNLTEYPQVVNTLKRFNLYPEIFLGIGYRIFQRFTDYFNIPTRECWEVMRGDSLPPVLSCEGIGEPSYFYVSAVFLWNGLVPAAIFIYGSFLSSSLIGGLIAVASFYFNHGECTRVQWTPPLRESFAYPLFLIQMFAVSSSLRNGITDWKQTLCIGCLTASFMLCWQFAQFALMTQTLALLGAYMLDFIRTPNLQVILKGQMLGHGISFVLLFGNKMLLSSFFTSVLISSFLISCLENKLKKCHWKPTIFVIQLLLLFCGSFSLKHLISVLLNTKDDAHIWNLLRSKFTSYQDFHTMLYTCAVEFDFIEKETLVGFVKTLLLPTGVIALLIILTQILLQKFKNWPNEAECPMLMYNFFQLVAFGVMAVLIMRLKLFFTPHLCLITSLFMSKKLTSLLHSKEVHYAIAFVLLGLMSVQGIQNLQYQRNILGEYSNPSLEELITWVNDSTPQDAVFAGPMPTMANLMLSTRRAVVNHPHYEDEGLRERVRKVYKLYSRRSAQEVYEELLAMGVQYVVIEKNWCYGRSREGCGLVDIWDVEDPLNRDSHSLCEKLLRNPNPFHGIFQNAVYAVLKV